MARAIAGLALLALALAGPAGAADLGKGYGFAAHAAPWCRAVPDAKVLISLNERPVLMAEVWRRYEHAALVATDHATIYSASPLFVWASEAKIACAKAYGYLRGHLWGPEKNPPALQKCECFHDRMLFHGGWR